MEKSLLLKDYGRSLSHSKIKKNVQIFKKPHRVKKNINFKSEHLPGLWA